MDRREADGRKLDFRAVSGGSGRFWARRGRVDGTFFAGQEASADPESGLRRSDRRTCALAPIGVVCTRGISRLTMRKSEHMFAYCNLPSQRRTLASY
jgi:hypothetical protein